jgi:hypothetical protein
MRVFPVFQTVLALIFSNGSEGSARPGRRSRSAAVRRREGPDGRLGPAWIGSAMARIRVVFGRPAPLHSQLGKHHRLGAPLSAGPRRHHRRWQPAGRRRPKRRPRRRSAVAAEGGGRQHGGDGGGGGGRGGAEGREADGVARPAGGGRAAGAGAGEEGSVDAAEEFCAAGLQESDRRSLFDHYFITFRPNTNYTIVL